MEMYDRDAVSGADEDIFIESTLFSGLICFRSDMANTVSRVES